MPLIPRSAGPVLAPWLLLGAVCHGLGVFFDRHASVAVRVSRRRIHDHRFPFRCGQRFVLVLVVASDDSLGILDQFGVDGPARGCRGCFWCSTAA